MQKPSIIERFSNNTMLHLLRFLLKKKKDIIQILYGLAKISKLYNHLSLITLFYNTLTN